MINNRLQYCTFWGELCAEFLSRVRFFATPWTVVHQAPLSLEFSRQECWSGLPCPLQETFLTLEPKDSLPSEPPRKPKNTGVGSLSLLQGSSRPRNRTRVSYIAGGVSTSRATQEALIKAYSIFTKSTVLML